jgi:metalloendopeptidase OMA1, mitochondrial
MPPMKLLAVVTAVLLSVLATGCVQRVEGSGRTQVAFYNDQQMNEMGAKAYADVLATETRCTDPATIAFVERVGRRLAAVAPDHGFTYEFTVLESATINAFCLPGGKVAVYTGILNLCENEAGLAAVLGHEIAHAIANHGNERMSQGVIIEGAQQGLATVLQAKGVSESTLNLSMTAFGIGSQLGVMLPFSRSHELEADRLGLDYMAKAGYDPKEAVAFWQRFAELGDGGQPNWMSTHPASGQRARELRNALPATEQLYAAAAQQYGSGEKVPKRAAAK